MSITTIPVLCQIFWKEIDKYPFLFAHCKSLIFTSTSAKDDGAIKAAETRTLPIVVLFSVYCTALFSPYQISMWFQGRTN